MSFNNQFYFIDREGVASDRHQNFVTQLAAQIS